MRRVQRRRRNPGAGVVLGTLAVTGGIAALVALAYQRKKPQGAEIPDETSSGLINEIRGDVVVGSLTRAQRILAQTQGRQEVQQGGKVTCRPPCGFGPQKEGAWNATCLVEAGKPGEEAALLMAGWQPGQVPPPAWAGWQREGWRAQGCDAAVSVYGVNDRSITREVGESDASWEARMEALRVEVLGPEAAARRRAEPVNEGVLAPNVKVLSGLGGVLEPALNPLGVLAGGGAIYLSVLRHKKLKFWSVVGAIFFPWIALPYQGAMVAIKK